MRDIETNDSLPEGWALKGIAIRSNGQPDVTNFMKRSAWENSL
jgi:hypothetical protein